MGPAATLALLFFKILAFPVVALGLIRLAFGILSGGIHPYADSD